MFIPLGTDRPLRRPVRVTYILLAINAAAFLLVTVGLYAFNERAAVTVYDALQLHPGAVTAWGFVTYAFLHGGWLHIIGNMLFLWVFGPNLEDRLGRVGFTAFYLAAGAVAGLVHILVESAPVIGASGAISGVTGAYLVLFPRTVIRCLVIFFIIGIFSIPAWWFIGFAIARDFVFEALGAQDNVARWAHLGGYAFGFAVALALLQLRIIPREAYDLFSMGRQAYRRRAIRSAVRKHGPPHTAKRRRTTDAAPKPSPDRADPRSEEIARRRAAVAESVARGELDAACREYARFVDAYDDSETAVTLSRRHQLDIANHFFSRGEHERAMHAYERFLDAYGNDPESARVRLMIALISARYLNDPLRAKQILRGLREALTDPDQRRLADQLVEELA